MRDALNLFNLSLQKRQRGRHPDDPLGRLTRFTCDGPTRLTSTRLYAAVEPGLLPMDATLTARASELTA
jgi:hypothetical protein